MTRGDMAVRETSGRLLRHLGSIAGVSLALTPLAYVAPAAAAAPAEETAKDEFPRDLFPDGWFSAAPGTDRYARRQAIEHREAPSLHVGDWYQHGTDGATGPGDLRGQIVLIDFWGTWCPPCLRALPHTQEIAEKYKDRGVSVIGVCNTRGSGTMRSVASQLGVRFPTAPDIEDRTVRAYGVSFFPTYVLVDRAGIVRAFGLRASVVEAAINKLLEVQPPGSHAAPGATATEGSAGTDRIDPEWLEGTAVQRRGFEKLEGAAAPGLPDASAEWINTEAPIQFDEFRGEVVLLTFFSAPHPPSQRSLRGVNELAEKHADRGLKVVGVCHPRLGERMGETAERFGAGFPMVLDADGKTFEAYGADSYPDYFIIDRDGNVAAADVLDRHLEDAVEAVLARPQAEDKTGKTR